MSDNAQPWKMSKPVDYAPKRVVSLVPSFTDSLFALQLGTRVIGVTDYCIRPAAGVAHLPKLGGTKNPDIERIIALRPDLVIMNQEENRREDAEVLEKAGVPIWVTAPNTIMESINLLWETMEIFDETDMVPMVRLIEQKWDVTRLAMENERPIRTFVPIWCDPWMTGNQLTYMHDVMHNFGMVNVFAERDRQFPLAADLGEEEALAADDPRIEGRDVRYPRVSLAEIETAQPELILLPDEPYVFSEADAAAFDDLDIPAVKLGNIYLTDGSLLLWHGTRFTYALSHFPPILADVRAVLAEWDAERE